MTDTTLQGEFDFYLKSRNQLAKDYEGKYIVIKDKKVIGVYDSRFDAYEETQKEHELGTFLIQLVSKDVDSYQQTFHSRVFV